MTDWIITGWTLIFVVLNFRGFRGSTAIRESLVLGKSIVYIQYNKIGRTSAKIKCENRENSQSAKV